MLIWANLPGQEIPILNSSIDANGVIELEVASTENHYYILNIRHSPTGDFEWSTSMTMGQAGTTIIREPLSAYPIEHYQVLEYPVNMPVDTDGDGDDDVMEFQNLPAYNPLNYAAPLNISNGAIAVNSLDDFKALSASDTEVPWAPFLNDKEFVKFSIVNIHSETPAVYFINTETHTTHGSFADVLGIDAIANQVITGEIIYHPTTVSSNGTLGVFSFNYSFGGGYPFLTVQKCHEFMAANMSFLKNNLSYYITANGNNDEYLADEALFETSRIPILFEADVFAEVDYLPLNVAEGFGFFRVMDIEETPGARDIVLYESLPNTLPRVGGIITSFIQTPLSHVNLRAIQDKIPNAFIRDPLQIDTVASLINKYVYYKVDQEEYFIREATLEEVNDWFDAIRPDEEQSPPLDLTHKSILPLDDIRFDMSDAFGAKCTNVATMRRFGLPEGTIPDGFGVPFYFYQEFMKYNGLFEEAEAMIAVSDFQSDLDTRVNMLDDFRDRIKDAGMPQWMLNELQAIHDQFPAGTSVRCRSSTNNEDLPGFSGAGLYTSKTQHPDEGHISKSIKQVYASMWNFRAYEERDFYRVNHYQAAMGVLCHPNYSDEKANGVGVSTDPIYQTDDTYYLNTQVGENLVTNPNALSVPEEILMDKVSNSETDHIVIRYSNLTTGNELIMTPSYLELMREFLTVIHDEFAILYNAERLVDFAMEVEYKITSEDQLIIKQARPWDFAWSLPGATRTPIELKLFPNPATDYLNIQTNFDLKQLSVVNLMGQSMLIQMVDTGTYNENIQLRVDYLPRGVYVLYGLGTDGLYFSEQFFKY